MKKLLTTLTLFAALALTACGGTGGSKSAKPTSHSHVWGEWQETPATCETDGVKTRTCTGEGECPKNNVETQPIPALGHDFTGTATAQTADAECTDSGVVKCSRCEKRAIRWAAKDYNTTESNDIEATKSDGSIRLQTARYWKGRGSDGEVDGTVEGSRLVYYINSYSAAQNVGFNFHIKQKSDWDGPLFAAQSGDELRGQNKIINEQGQEEFVRSDYRYELRINDVVVPFKSDTTEVSQGTEGWFDWPVNSFNINNGKNKIEIICLGGYRAYLFDFQLTGLPGLAALA